MFYLTDQVQAIGLNIVFPENEIEHLMWKLFLEYEEDMILRTRFNAEDFLTERWVDEHVLTAAPRAYVESEKLSHVLQVID